MDVALEVVLERQRQDAKWGPQDHPWVRTEARQAVPAYLAGIVSAGAAKAICDQADREGVQTFARILVEEVAEALEAPTDADVREELIQVAAVAVAAVEALDRKTELFRSHPQRWVTELPPETVLEAALAAGETRRLMRVGS